MENYFKHHGKYFISLLSVFALCVFAITQTTYSKDIQMLIVMLAALLYVGLGIAHHITHHDLSAKIVIEYTLIGSLGMSIVLFFLRGGFF